MSLLTLVEGWYDDTLVQETKRSLSLKKARIVNIDCDLYESTRATLQFITDLVTNGTVLMFDDWFCYRGDPRKGENRAVSDWLSENPRIMLSHYRNYANVGKSFIVTTVDDSDNTPSGDAAES